MQASKESRARCSEDKCFYFFLFMLVVLSRMDLGSAHRQSSRVILILSSRNKLQSVQRSD